MDNIEQFIEWYNDMLLKLAAWDKRQKEVNKELDELLESIKEYGHKE